MERRNKCVVEIGLTMMMRTYVPMTWEYGLKIVVHLMNKKPSKTLNNLNPFKLLFHKKPTYDYLRVMNVCVFLISGHIN